MHVRTPAIILIIPPPILIDASISGNIEIINPVVEMTVPINPCDVALSFILIMGQQLHTVCLGLE